LFTAFSDEPNWRKAHDILPARLLRGAMARYHATMLGCQEPAGDVDAARTAR